MDRPKTFSIKISPYQKTDWARVLI